MCQDLSSISNFTEDQQALEDEGILMKPNIPLSMPNRSQPHGQLPNVASVINFGQTTNPMMSSFNPSMLPYTQNYFGNQAIATPGFIANNFPASTNPNVGEPSTRRKSIIDNINPFISEQKVLPTADLLSAFPVSKNETIFTFELATKEIFNTNLNVIFIEWK